MTIATQILAYIAVFSASAAGGIYFGVWLERRRLQAQMDQYLAASNQKWKKARGVR